MPCGLNNVALAQLSCRSKKQLEPCSHFGIIYFKIVRSLKSINFHSPCPSKSFQGLRNFILPTTQRTCKQHYSHSDNLSSFGFGNGSKIRRAQNAQLWGLSGGGEHRSDTVGGRSPGCFFWILPKRSIPRSNQHRKEIIQQEQLGTDMLQELKNSNYERYYTELINRSCDGCLVFASIIT